MIIVKLLGGLGNQMFQYAAGMALAKKYGLDIYLDMSYFNEWYDMTPRPFELDKFHCDVRYATPEEIGRIVRRGRLRRTADSILQNQKVLIKENGQPAAIQSGKKLSVYLDGYWQSENYFKEFEADIRNCFRFRDLFSARTKGLASEIKANRNSVSVHIRRGDYLASEAMANWLGVCSPDYYSRAFQHISASVDQPFYYVFSDDLNWVQENIIKDNSHMLAVTHNRKEDSWQDMYLMSLCRNHIIANSSFSWWGAWLDANPGKVVIAPDKWFLASELQDQIKNIVPAGWVRF
jgi:hypothetical protein